MGLTWHGHYNEVVLLQWFTDSVECGYCLEENNYAVVEGGKSSSTPNDAYQSDWSDMLDQFTVPTDISACLLDGCKVGHIACVLLFDWLLLV